MNTQVLGISIDHIPCLEAWADSLGGITYPLVSDFWPHGEVCQKYGVLRAEGFSERAIFVVDRLGIIRYIDIHDIDEQPRNDELFAILRAIDPEAAAKAPIEKDEVPVELPHGGIVMYCTSWCPGCRRARAWLSAHDLPYKEVDISKNRTAAKQVTQWTGGYETTPTFDIDGKIVIEFDEEEMYKILKDRIKS